MQTNFQQLCSGNKSCRKQAIKTVGHRLNFWKIKSVDLPFLLLCWKAPQIILLLWKYARKLSGRSCVISKKSFFSHKRFYLKWHIECCMHAKNQDRSPRKTSRLKQTFPAVLFPVRAILRCIFTSSVLRARLLMTFWFIHLTRACFTRAHADKNRFEPPEHYRLTQ